MTKEKITIDDLDRLAVENHNEIKDELGQIKTRLTRVEQGQDEIKLRLDNVAYRFELKELN